MKSNQHRASHNQYLNIVYNIFLIDIVVSEAPFPHMDHVNAFI
jgi:hypothetical protein